MGDHLTRRGLLRGGLALGCSAAASPLMTPVVMAATPGDMRLVVIILRGGMDGLDVLRPVGDPGYAALRGELEDSAAGAELTGLFRLHPALSDLLPLWQAGEFAAVQATSTPYRDKRSHFDGQDLLEAGTGALGERRDGWLNRALQGMTGVEAQTAFALGQEQMKLLNGAAPVSDWVPGADLAVSAQAELLAGVMMQADPRFAPVWDAALALSAEEGGQMAGPARAHHALAEFAAARLLEDTRIISFSLGGWDTHARQSTALPRALERLSDVILTLRARAAPVWDRTVVMAMTEFGRTAALNGTGGTDHGTGGAVVMAGGALKGGRVLGRWPGLSEADLYNRRDLMPTSDLRRWPAWALHDMLGLSRSALEGGVFPGLDMGPTPGLLL